MRANESRFTHAAAEMVDLELIGNSLGAMNVGVLGEVAPGVSLIIRILRSEYLDAHPYDRAAIADVRFRVEPEEEEGEEEKKDEGGSEEGDDDDDENNSCSV